MIYYMYTCIDGEQFSFPFPVISGHPVEHFNQQTCLGRKPQAQLQEMQTQILNHQAGWEGMVDRQIRFARLMG